MVPPPARPDEYSVFCGSDAMAIQYRWPRGVYAL
jgi:hypothetical protein